MILIATYKLYILYVLYVALWLSGIWMDHFDDKITATVCVCQSLQPPYHLSNLSVVIIHYLPVTQIYL